MTPQSDSAFFRVERAGEIAAVTLIRERITDEDNVDQFGQGLTDLVETGGVRRLLVDVSGLEYVTSSVLGKLIFLHRRLARDGGQMVLCGVRPTLLDILDATRLTTLFTIAEDEEAGRKLLDQS